MKITHFVLAVGLLLCGIARAEQPASEPMAFSIAPQPMQQALKEFARQSGYQLFFQSQIAKHLVAPAITETITPEQALEKLLVNSGLRYYFVNSRTIAIRPETPMNVGAMLIGDPQAIATVRDQRGSEAVTLAQAGQTMQKVEKTEASASEENKEAEDSIESNSDKDSDSPSGVSEIVVTGTHIEGAPPVGSLVLSFSQEDFQRAGAGTVEQFLSALPQNFESGASAELAQVGYGRAGGNAVFNRAYGTSVNLRGLGAGTTLVLVNGRRVANVGGELLEPAFTDISMIPLAAVERLEIVLDGASAIYGSDAIGGVVNIILRKQYTGAQTQVRLGTTSQGGGDELHASQTLGFGWGTGHSVLTYQYQRNDGINVLDRKFLAKDPFVREYPRHVIQPSRKHGAFLSAEQKLSSRMTLFGDLAHSQRSGQEQWLSFFEGQRYERIDNRQSSASLGVRAELPAQLDFTVTATVSGIDSENFGIDELSSSVGAETISSTHENRIWSVEGILGGELWTLPAGVVRFALGLGHRDERDSAALNITGPAGAYTPGPTFSRTVDHAFAEMRVPLLRPRAGSNSARLLSSVAARYEDYSQFGGTFNPKVGLQWQASATVQLRANYGTSFRAPGLYQTNPAGVSTFLNGVLDPARPGEVIRVVQQFGSNALLDPETATTWSVGLQWIAQRVPGLHVELNYYEIDYDDRIDTAQAQTNLAHLIDPQFAPARVVRGDISDAQFNALIAELLSRPVFRSGTTLSRCNAPIIPNPDNPSRGACTEDPSNFDAFLDGSLRNLGASRDRGIDVNLEHRFDTASGTLQAGFNATYLIEHNRQLTAAAPSFDLVGTTYNPPRFRVRSSLMWSRAAWAVTGTVNHLPSYDNNVIVPEGRIPSWTTTDLNVRYDVSASAIALLAGTSIVLDVNNLFDEVPTVFTDPSIPGGGLFYDAANSDPYGRRFSLMFVKQWGRQ